MAWNNIISQGNIKSELQKLIINNRVPSALCFWGNLGVGKFATAIQFVKTLTCLKPKKDGDFIDSCDNCNNCLKINKGIHPNLEFIYSLPSTKTSEEAGTIASFSEEQLAKIREALVAKIEQPYKRFQIEGANQIRIDQIRDLRQKLALSNALPGRKFVLILEANEMRVEAQNALLKTLEEPRENITFILICSNRNALLSTVLSRCQMIYFPPLDEELIAQELQKKLNVDERKSKLIAKFSDGSFTQALEFAVEEIVLIRNKMVDFLRHFLRKEYPSATLTKEISAFTQKMDKKGALFALELLSKWFRDCFVYGKSANYSLIRNFDDLQTIERFVNKFGTKAMDKILDVITNSEKFVISNVQISYIFLNMFISLREILLEKESLRV
ncbi:MAG: DNA polymerase III subunit [Candidatus Kapaibacteriales bacterium]